MCTVTLELSDELVAIAEKQGLLTPSALEAYILKSVDRSETTRSKSVMPLLELWGSCKGEDTLEAYFERKCADKIREDENERQFRESV